MLSNFYLEKQRLGQIRQIETLKNISPITCSHINLIEKYNSKKFNIALNFSMINELMKYDILTNEKFKSEDIAEISFLNCK